MTVLDVSRPAPSPVETTQEQRIVEAALRCFTAGGVTGTSLDDVAREAGYSRATVYRCFPGGKDALVAAVARTEVARFLGAVADAVAAVADDGVEAVLVAGMVEAGRRFSGHDALQHLLAHEPGVVLPHLAFGGMDAALRVAGDFARPWLTPYLDEQTAVRVGEWAARILLSFVSSPAPGVDITDEASIRSLVQTFVLPGTADEGDL